MVFRQGRRRIFLENSRKWGKTEWAIDMCWRLGNLIQNGQGYFFSSYLKNVLETIWENGRLKNHGPADYIEGTSETETRLTFSSGTFIKCEGALEFQVGRGFNPDFLILDEFADYTREFWAAVSSNLIPKNAYCFVMGSIPEVLEDEPGKPTLYIAVADLWKKRMEEGHALYGYVNQNWRVNPHNDPALIEQDIADLREMGMEDVAEREYEAKRVVGGGKRIIANFDPEIHVKPHAWILERFSRDLHHLTKISGCDPGSSSVFGALIVIINPWNKEVYVVDEIHETDERETMVAVLIPKLLEMEKQYSTEPDDFIRVYDEAAKMFQLEVASQFDIGFLPTEKSVNSIEDGVSIIRTIFRLKKCFVSDRCRYLAHELLNWRKKKNGEFSKDGKHLIDCFRYALHVAGYEVPMEDRPEEERVLEWQKPRRGIEEDIADVLDEVGRETGTLLFDNLGDDVW